MSTKNHSKETDCHILLLLARDLLDFGSSFDRSSIWLLLPNPAPTIFGRISGFGEFQQAATHIYS